MSKEKEVPTGLYWQGKKTEVDRVVLPFQTIETINESRADREKEKTTSFGLFDTTEPDSEWYNRLIWGDNKYIMASLLEEFAGKIDLIYIDPPFATGADFSVKMNLGDEEWTKEPSAIEDKAYRDTWGNGLDSYLQMMYERLIIMRDLLSDKGSIYIHLDWHVSHYIKVVLDDIFGYNNFRNEIIWCYTGPSKPRLDFPDKHDVILRYSKTDDRILNIDLIKIPYSQSFLQRRSYTEGSGGIMGGRDYDEKKSDNNYKEGKLPEDWWSDIPTGGQMSINELLGYKTQKPEKLLNRIIKSSSNEGDLVADFFCGSGTTSAVAEKLGRRWIMADLGRYAIHTTRKRMLGIENCSPFKVQNLGKYERQHWQGITFKKRSKEQQPVYEYLNFILKLYNAEPLTGMLNIHGKRGKHFVHIGSVDAPVTLAEILEAMEELKKAEQKHLDILGWEWEMGLHNVVEKAAKEHGISLRLFSIPRDVMDPRAVEKKEITFYELAYLDAEINKQKSGNYKVKLTDFAIPNLDLIPEDVRDKIKKWSDYIDYWAVDWNWNQDTFHNMWQSYRTRKERKLDLVSDSHTYEKKGKHLVMIKVIDIFGNDTTRIIEVDV